MTKKDRKRLDQALGNYTRTFLVRWLAASATARTQNQAFDDAYTASRTEADVAYEDLIALIESL